MSPGPYRSRLTPHVMRQLSGPPRGLPLGVASAVVEFITRRLLDNPWRVGKPLHGRFAGQHVARCGPDHRIRYEIDDATRTVVVLGVARRADAYRGE